MPAPLAVIREPGTPRFQIPQARVEPGPCVSTAPPGDADTAGPGAGPRASAPGIFSGTHLRPKLRNVLPQGSASRVCKASQASRKDRSLAVDGHFCLLGEGGLAELILERIHPEFARETGSQEGVLTSGSRQSKAHSSISRNAGVQTARPPPVPGHSDFRLPLGCWTSGPRSLARP